MALSVPLSASQPINRFLLTSALLLPCLFLLAALFLPRGSPPFPISIYSDLSLPPPPSPPPPPPPPPLPLPPPHSLSHSPPLPEPSFLAPGPADAAGLRQVDDGVPSVPEPSFSEPEPAAPPDRDAAEARVGHLTERWQGKCDIYQGRWERDEEGRYPLYSPGSCPYVDEAFSCQENGRPDRDYLKWRWKPRDCDLPRFNATNFLERLRGKRLMLVGDSMNRNQYESLLCLLREALPDKSKMYETRGNRITKGRGYFIFKFVDYNCTVEFVRSHFLVREGTRVNRQGNLSPTLTIDCIDKSANRWKRADILVFNTGHWWTHGKTARGKNYYREGDVLYPQLDAIEAYRRAMRTWGKWIDKNMDPARNLVFYRGYSTAHFRGGDWNSGGTCNGETDPILNGAFPDGYPLKMKIVEEVIHEMHFPVIILNVTKLTNFRKDGHPAIYGKTRSQGQKISKRKQDCSHWCLPGVPDSWNELIYSALVLE